MLCIIVTCQLGCQVVEQAHKLGIAAPRHNKTYKSGIPVNCRQQGKAVISLQQELEKSYLAWHYAKKKKITLHCQYW